MVQCGFNTLVPALVFKVRIACPKLAYTRVLTLYTLIIAAHFRPLSDGGPPDRRQMVERERDRGSHLGARI